MFARRGYNVQSLAVGPSEREGMSRICMVVPGKVSSPDGSSGISPLLKQLSKLVFVQNIVDLTDIPFVNREMMLIKVGRGPYITFMGTMGHGRNAAYTHNVGTVLFGTPHPKYLASRVPAANSSPVANSILAYHQSARHLSKLPATHLRISPTHREQPHALTRLPLPRCPTCSSEHPPFLLSLDHPQVRCSASQRGELHDLASIFRGSIVDVSAATVTMEVVGKEDKMKAITGLLEPYGGGRGVSWDARRPGPGASGERFRDASAWWRQTPLIAQRTADSRTQKGASCCIVSRTDTPVAGRRSLQGTVQPCSRRGKCTRPQPHPRSPL